MANELISYIRFEPNNYDNLYTSNNDLFLVKHINADVQEFKLYKNRSELNRVDKTLYIAEIGSIFGVFRETVSITNLTIVIEYNKFIDFNYIYIPTLNRYYFVTEVKIINNKLYEIDLTVDVLMSYKDAIKSTQAFIDRNEHTYNELLEDKKRVIETGYDIVSYNVTNELFKEIGLSTPSYVINGYKIESVSV